MDTDDQLLGQPAVRRAFPVPAVDAEKPALELGPAKQDGPPEMARRQLATRGRAIDLAFTQTEDPGGFRNTDELRLIAWRSA